MHIILLGVMGAGLLHLCVIAINLMNELEEIANNDWNFFDEIDVDIAGNDDDDDDDVI